MVWYKWENQIPDTAIDKKLNAAANKDVNANKRQVTIASKKLNIAA